MRQMLALFGKELRILVRDPFLLFAMVWFFTAEIYIAGTGIRMELHQAATMVLDEDKSLASRQWASGFHAPWFELKAPVADMEAAQRLMDFNKLTLLANIPFDFSSLLLRKQPAEIQAFVDGSNLTFGSLAASYLTLVHQQYNLTLLYQRMHLSPAQRPPLPQVDHRFRLLFNQTNNDSWFMAMTELFMVMALLGMLLPAALSIREKERGTIEQLMVAPLTPAQIMLPKVFTVMLILVLGGLMSLMGIIVGLLHTPVRGNIALFLLAVALFAFALSGLGLFIATLARNLGQIMLLVFMFMMPMTLLSGAWTQPEAMPQWEQQLMTFTPLYHFNMIGHSIILKGASLMEIWPHLAALAAIGAVLFSLGAWRFRRQFG